MQSVICGGIRYESVIDCAERTEYSVPQLCYALRGPGRIGYDSVSYGNDRPKLVGTGSLVVVCEPLVRSPCRHRLGVHHGGQY